MYTYVQIASAEISSNRASRPAHAIYSLISLPFFSEQLLLSRELLSSLSLSLLILSLSFFFAQLSRASSPLCSVVVYVSLLRFLPRIAESFVSVALCVFLVVSSFSLSLLALLALESPLPATAARLQWQCERRARVVALFVYLARICPRARGLEGN